MRKDIYLSVVTALATVAAIVLFLMLAAPVAKPFAWAVIIGISTMPHYNRLAARMPRHPGGSAGLMVLIVAICFILPIVALVVNATLNADEWYRDIANMVSTVAKSGAATISDIPVVDRLLVLGKKFGVELSTVGSKLAAASSSFLVGLATEAAKNLLDLLVTLVIALFILFFVYRDGERLVEVLIGKLASNREKAESYVSEIRSITTAVTVGTIFTCATQGVTAGIGYYVAGVPAPIFCGALTAIAALVPVVGTGVIWVPVTAFVALNGSYLSAALLALWCMIFVGLADNAIRPLAIGAATDIPVLAIVLGAICGVVTMGLLGLILGPVLFAILMTTWSRAVSDVEGASGDAPPSGS
ncbi:AI-2E family transporter [Geomonas sp. Red32]|uniref:AI-2E family transporter n=1 Tax=Geomonas sp. Red32 TaxID=2912856 RepID=UPI00202CDF2E|nr:AI-2E family transporter [Geomonas sp. Red32]MCM0083099.1 AI-2E family transporter [Geomonas sp. Red32]